MTPNCVCVECKEQFYRKESRRNKRDFCNKACLNAFNARQSSVTSCKCSSCGAVFTRTKNQLRRSKTGLLFCNNTCKNVYVAQQCRWDVMPYRYRSRRKYLFEVVQDKCQKCGYNEDARMLDVHHYDGNHHNNAWKNLRCVCVWCHIKHHRGVEPIGDLPVIVTGFGAVGSALHLG